MNVVYLFYGVLHIYFLYALRRIFSPGILKKVFILTGTSNMNLILTDIFLK